MMRVSDKMGQCAVTLFEDAIGHGFLPDYGLFVLRFHTQNEEVKYAKRTVLRVILFWRSRFVLGTKVLMLGSSPACYQHRYKQLNLEKSRKMK